MDEPGASRSFRSVVAWGVVWSALDQWLSRLLTTVVLVVLARLLAPEHFGTVALAHVFVVLITAIVEQGFGAALVQRSQLQPRLLDTAFWTNLAFGGAGVVLIQLLAAPISAALGQEELAPVLRVLALNFTFVGLAVVPRALLQRDLLFRRLAVRNLAATLVSGAVALAMALQGLGVWALVGQSLSATVVGTAVLWFAVPWRPHMNWDRESFRLLFGFGANVMSINLLNFLNRHFDNFLVGAILGPVALGYYAVAYRVLRLLTDLFISVTSRVAFPAFSRIQDSPEKVRSALTLATRSGALIGAPAFLLLAALSPQVVRLVFGSQWEPSITVMRVLALIGALHAAQFFMPPALMALGRARTVMLLTGANAIGNVIGFSIGLRWGILGVASAYVIRGYLFSPIPVLALRRAVGFTGLHFIRAVGWPMSSAIVAGIVAMLLTAQVPHWGPYTQLAFAVLAGALIYVALVSVLAREHVLTLVRLARSLSRAQGEPR